MSAASLTLHPSSEQTRRDTPPPTTCLTRMTRAIGRVVTGILINIGYLFTALCQLPFACWNWLVTKPSSQPAPADDYNAQIQAARKHLPAAEPAHELADGMPDPNDFPEAPAVQSAPTPQVMN